MNAKQQVINARANGMSYSQITRDYGVAKSTAQGWVNAKAPQVGYVNDNFRRKTPAKAEKNLENIQEFINNLAPIQISPSVTNLPIISFSDYALVIGDMHFGHEDQKVLDIFLATVAEINPKTIILNGDTLDLLSVSRYPKDIRHNYTLGEERKAYHQFLHSLVEVSGGAEILETNANHSGNSVEGRWWRYVSERLGELASLDDIREKFSYENVFMGEYQNHVKLVDYVQLTNDFVILHGDVVRKNGGYSARGMMDKWFTSLMHNHTHRMGSTAQRIPGIGNKKGKQLYGYENGCACSLKPIYASVPNWQQGFSIIGLDGDDFSVEQVMVNDGRANIATLGCTMRA
jgi:hypothetical protein